MKKCIKSDPKYDPFTKTPIGRVKKNSGDDNLGDFLKKFFLSKWERNLQMKRKNI